MQIVSKIVKTAVLALCLVLITNSSFSQGGNPPDNEDPTDVPIDGGLSLLVAAGVGYVAKKGYDKRKKNQEASLEK